ncbi:MAG: hypothetical protein RID25_12365 [Cyclobacteriaceae bacterium]
MKNIFLLIPLIMCLFSCGKEDEVFVDAEPREIIALDEQLNISGSKSLMRYSSPFIAFNYPIQKEFNLSKSPESNYRYKVIDINYSNFNVPYDTLWNETKDTLYFVPERTLRINQEVTFGIILKLQKFKDDQWLDVVDSAWQFDPNHYITKDFKRVVNSYAEELPELKFINIEDGDSLDRYPNPIRIQFGAKVNESLKMTQLHETLFTELDLAIHQNGNEVPYQFEPVWNGYDIVISDPLCKECAYELVFSLNYYREIFEDRYRIENIPEVSHSYKFYGKNTSGQGIVDENIQYSYPGHNQYYFLRKEYDKGYLKLKYPQPEVYHSDGSDLWEMEVVISNLLGFPVHSSKVTYDHEENYFEYDLDGDLLNNETIYKVEFFESSQELQEFNLFHTYYFRTSSHDTFKEKFGNIIFLNSYFWSTNQFYLIGKSLRIENEPFDKFETRQAIIGVPDLDNTPYYTDYIYPLVYSGVDEKILTPSVEVEKGFPKIYVGFYLYPSFELTEENILLNNAERAPFDGQQQGLLEDETYHWAAVHFNDLKQKSQYYYDQDNPWIQSLQNSKFPSFTDQDHPYKLQYILPGKNYVTSEETYTWHHPFK